MNEAAVEVLDTRPQWCYGNLAANFARVQLLVTWYGSDPDRYLDAIAEGREHPDDLAFLQQLKGRLSDDPSLLADMRRIVAEFANRFASC